MEPKYFVVTINGSDGISYNIECDEGTMLEGIDDFDAAMLIGKLFNLGYVVVNRDDEFVLTGTKHGDPMLFGDSYDMVDDDGPVEDDIVDDKNYEYSELPLPPAKKA